MGPLRYRDFRFLWIGWVLGATGSWVHQVATLWLILELTNSPFMLGLSGLFMSVPFLVTSLFGGALADRMDRRKLLLVTQGIAAILAFVPGVLSGLGVIQVWHLYALSFVSWTVGAFDGPARHAMIPSLVPEKQLMGAIALTAVIRRSTALVGPMIGGGAITFFGVTGAFFLHAMINVMVLATIFQMRTGDNAIDHRRAPMGRSIMEGLKTARGSRVIFGILCVEAVHTMTVTYQTLMPIFARDVLKVGPSGLGLLYMSAGVGALIGSAILVKMGDVKNKGKIFLLTVLIQPSAILLFGLSPWLILSMTMLAVSGVFEVIGGTVRNAMLQLSTENRVRGRIMGLNMMVHRGLGPLSGLPAGSVATLIGAPLAISGGAVFFILYALFMFMRVPELYRYRIRASDGASAGSEGKMELA
jgi:MFS family permease